MINSDETTPKAAPDADLGQLEMIAKLLDNQFRVPGTKWRFGLDGLIGLVPYVGDMAGLIVSGFLMRTMLRKGASPWIMLRMMGNYLLDALVGIVPLLGDLFDFGFKAHRRNINMLKSYYASGEKRPSATLSLGALGLLFFGIFIGILWFFWRFSAWLLGHFF